MPVETGYRANAFAPECGPRVSSGTLRVFPDRIEFTGDLLKGTLPMVGLLSRRGGHNDEQIFFEHPAHAGWSIYSSDEALLTDEVLRNDPRFASILRSVSRTRRAPPPPVYIGLAIAAIILLCLTGLWLAKDRIAEWVADKIPVSVEEKLGEQVFRQVASQGKLVTNSAWSGAVAEITQRLLPTVADSGYNFRFHILQDTNVNAFAIPGGHVVILTGLLERAENAEEVAGVLAHELAHVTRRHSLRNIVKSAGLILLLQVALGDASGLLAIAAEGSRYLLQQKFSRDFEREADETGWQYLVEAKIDPRGMIRFFERIKRLSEEAGMAAMEGSLALLNTHPASQERIDRLTAKWNQMEKVGFVPLPALR